MSPEEREQLMQADAGPNLPQEQQGANPTERYLTPDERMKRRLAIERLVQDAPTVEETFQILHREYGMSREAVKSALRTTRARMKEEFAEREEYRKMEQVARILREISIFTAQGKGSAVANLEKVLASILGTEAPKEQFHHVQYSVADSLMEVMGEWVENDPARLREIVEAQMKLDNCALPPAEPEREVVVVPVENPAAKRE